MALISPFSALLGSALGNTAYEIGKKVSNAGRRGGKAKGMSKTISDQHMNWKKRADQMRKSNPDRSARSIALSIAKKTGGNFNTIRKIIKK